MATQLTIKDTETVRMVRENAARIVTATDRGGFPQSDARGMARQNLQESHGRHL